MTSNGKQAKQPKQSGQTAEIPKKSKNRLDNLPSDLVIYVHSFLDEKECHQQRYEKLYFDKSFQNLMWDKFSWVDTAFSIVDEKEVIEDEIWSRVKRSRKEKKMKFLPSDVKVGNDEGGDWYIVDIKTKEKTHHIELLFYNDDEIIDMLGDYLSEIGDGLINIDSNLLANCLNQKAVNLGFDEDDILRFREKEDYETLKKLINFDELTETINSYHLEEFIESVFRGDSCFEANDGYLRIMEASTSNILD